MRSSWAVDDALSITDQFCRSMIGFFLTIRETWKAAHDLLKVNAFDGIANTDQNGEFRTIESVMTLRDKCSPSAVASAFHALVKSRDTGRTLHMLMQVDEVVRLCKHETFRYAFYKMSTKILLRPSNKLTE